MGQPDRCLPHHANNVAVDCLREDAPAGGDVVHDLVEGGALDLLPLMEE